MPVLDGYEATKAIRERESAVVPAFGGGRPRVPIVAVTADALESARQQCLAAGMDDWLVKPIGKGQLLKVVEQWLSGGPADRGPSSSPYGPENRFQLDEQYTVFRELTSKVVHDLRTLLIGINRTLLLSKQGGGCGVESAERTLTDLVAAAQLVLGTIDDRLDLYQSRCSGFRLQYESVSLGQAASDAVACLDGEARDRGGRVVVEGADSRPPVAGDKRRIQRVLVNLLNHMIQGSARGGTIRVRFEVANENGSCVECYVEKDDPEARGEPITDPRRSERGAFEDAPECGQDISLEFCREVIRAHGGTIWANTHAGWAAEFGFRLPIERAVHGD